MPPCSSIVVTVGLARNDMINKRTWRTQPCLELISCLVHCESVSAVTINDRSIEVAVSHMTREGLCVCKVRERYALRLFSLTVLLMLRRSMTSLICVIFATSSQTGITLIVSTNHISDGGPTRWVSRHSPRPSRVRDDASDLQQVTM